MIHGGGIPQDFSEKEKLDDKNECNVVALQKNRESPMAKQEESGWQAFLELCSKMQSEKSLEEFFSLFLTAGEREVMAARCRIIQALLDGTLTQREIAERYHVSIAQITRGSNALKCLSTRFKKVLQKLRCSQ
jgi:trp operon repressor, proteobacterial